MNFVFAHKNCLCPQKMFLCTLTRLHCGGSHCVLSLSKLHFLQQIWICQALMHRNHLSCNIWIKRIPDVCLVGQYGFLAPNCSLIEASTIHRIRAFCVLGIIICAHTVKQGCPNILPHLLGITQISLHRDAVIVLKVDCAILG